MCVNYVLASSRITQVDLDDEPPPEVDLSHATTGSSIFLVGPVDDDANIILL
jgi:hypothetical protein